MATVDFNLDRKILIDQDSIKESFISSLMKMHKKTREDAEMTYEKESMYYKKALSEPNNRLVQCTGISLYSAFLDIAITGLSIQPGNKSEAYLEARGSKSGDNWINTARLVVTAYGELNMRIMAGQIIRMMNPVVLYTGDHFQPKTNDRGRLIVEYMPQIPRQKDARIFGAYVCIELPGGSLDFKWLLDDDIERLRKYSIPKGKEGSQANALYSANNGQIDPGFLEAKTIKHAMRAYTKLKVGESTSFEEEEIDPEPTFIPQDESGATKKVDDSVSITNTDEPF